jgi:hypothetical protein
MADPVRATGWVLGDGKFVSFWPPDYQATYVVRWVVAEGAITGLTFTETERGARFEGTSYEPPASTDVPGER